MPRAGVGGGVDRLQGAQRDPGVDLGAGDVGVAEHPPPYIKQELGERPAERAKQRAWDYGVEAIEAYRQHYGLKDPHRALGRERERQRQRETLRRIREAQRVLGLGQHASRKRDLGRLLGIGR